MTTYITHPAEYPQTVFAVQGRAGRWWVTRDWWDTPTSHTGATRIAGPYRTRAEARTAMDHDDGEYGDE